MREPELSPPHDALVRALKRLVHSDRLITIEHAKNYARLVGLDERLLDD